MKSIRRIIAKGLLKLSRWINPDKDLFEQIYQDVSMFGVGITRIDPKDFYEKP